MFVFPIFVYFLTWKCQIKIISANDLSKYRVKMSVDDDYPVLIKSNNKFVAMVPVNILVKESVIFKSLVDQKVVTSEANAGQGCDEGGTAGENANLKGE